MSDEDGDDGGVEDEVQHSRTGLHQVPKLWCMEVDVHKVLEGRHPLHFDALLIPAHVCYACERVQRQIATEIIDIYELKGWK